jgi:hypothetical protein
MTKHLLFLGIDVVLEEERVHRRRNGEVHLAVVVADDCAAGKAFAAADSSRALTNAGVDDDVIVLPLHGVPERRARPRTWG